MDFHHTVMSSSTGHQPRAWQRMLSGRRLDILDPSPVDIEIEDIAHGLARVARWNGQTTGVTPFSVAQHSIIVERFCSTLKPDWPVKWQVAALLHDAPEYVIGDMISPFKAAIGDTYKKIEASLQAAIHLRFGLPAHPPQAVMKQIKKADRASAYFEAVQIAGFAADEAARLFGEPKGLDPFTIDIMTTTEAENAFRARFENLIQRL